MIPLMILLLLLMCAAYSAHLADTPHHVPTLTGIYTAYALIAAATAHLVRPALNREQSIALAFSAVTRNSLIIFPLVNALAATLRTTTVDRADAGRSTNPNSS